MILELEDVGHGFPNGDLLFQGITLSLHPGNVYALTGPSGSGKSTLLSILASWLVPSLGRVRTAGIHRISWVFQNPHGVARRTALDHVALPHLARGLGRGDAQVLAHAQLKAFALATVASQQFRNLSGGEAQRLMLARGIASAPDLLLIDEPTAQLDRRTAELVNASIHAVRSERTIVVVATHDPMTRDGCTDEIDLGLFR